MTEPEALYVIRKWREWRINYLITHNKDVSLTDSLVQLVHDAIAFQAKKAGKISSRRKRQSSRANGKLGGRPKNNAKSK